MYWMYEQIGILQKTGRAGEIDIAITLSTKFYSESKLYNDWLIRI